MDTRRKFLKGVLAGGAAVTTVAVAWIVSLVAPERA